MMRRARGFVGAAFGLVLVLESAPVLCAPSDASGSDESEVDRTREAKDLTRAGIAQYRKGNLDQAREQFAKAWALKPSTELAAILAEVEMKLTRYDEAAAHWEYYIQNLPPDRSDAEFQLAECRKHLGSVRVAVDTPGAIVSLDGQTLGPAPLRVDVWVSPGTHVFAARAQDLGPVSQPITIVAGEAQMVSLVLGKGAAAGSGGPAPAAPPEPPKDRGSGGGSSAKTLVLIGGGVLSAAAVGVGVGFTLKANSAGDDADALLAAIASQADPSLGASHSYCSQPAAERPQQCDLYSSKQQEQTNAQTVAIVSYVAGGVLAVGTVVTAFLWPSSEEHAGMARPFVVAGPGELRLGLGGRF